MSSSVTPALDAIWLKVKGSGPGQCHVGYKSCFYRVVGLGGPAERATLETTETKSYNPDLVYQNEASTGPGSS